MHGSQDHELARCRVRTPCTLESVSHRCPCLSHLAESASINLRQVSQNVFVCRLARVTSLVKIRFEQTKGALPMQRPAGKHLSCELRRPRLCHDHRNRSLCSSHGTDQSNADRIDEENGKCQRFQPLS